MSYFKPLFLLACFLAPMSCFCVDIENGEEINEVCAGCHGEYGQGGKDGEYPRLAGMPAAFRSKQLHLFRERIRPNLAMVEYVDDRQMPDEDIEDIAHYLEHIELKTKLPPADETSPDFNAYERLIQSKHLMQIPRAPGDVVRGRESYKKECAVCHGREGWGKMDKAIPLLAGQYTNYLWRQVRKYREGIRIHDAENPNEELLSDFSDNELSDIFAYLSTVDD